MKTIVIILILFTQSAYTATFKKSLYNSINTPQVWAPAATALVLALTKFDGKITDYASRKNPIYGNDQSASNFSDAITFYYLPVALVTTHLTNSYYSKNRGWFKNSSILYPALATYFVNSSLKDRTGRIRPDNSNRESFPSSHTALASSFSESINLNSKFIKSKKFRYSLMAMNEVLVIGVAWARMEAKKHHLSDVLAGYSIGRFFSRLFHNLIFNEDSDAQITVNAMNDHYKIGLQWNF